MASPVSEQDIDLVEENNSWSVTSGMLKQLLDVVFTLPCPLAHDVRAAHMVEL